MTGVEREGEPYTKVARSTSGVLTTSGCWGRVRRRKRDIGTEFSLAVRLAA
jgi:hypothetical protein